MFNSVGKNGFVIIALVGLLVVSSFFIGSLYTKVTMLEGGGLNNALNVLPAQAEPSQPQVAGVNKDKIAPITENDHFLGNINAKIALIEYSDLECPFCQKFHPTAKQLINENKDVVWVYRHYPLTSIHSTAQGLAEASECATKLGGNNAFWSFVDEVFARQPGVQVSDLSEIAQNIGIDLTAFSTCLESGEMAERVNKDLEEGTAAGVTGTPGNILYNTESGDAILLPGAVPIGTINEAISTIN